MDCGITQPRGDTSLPKFSKSIGGVLMAMLLVSVATPLLAAPPASLQSPEISTVADRFLAADEARDKGDFTLAEQLYRALIAETDGELRIEARFRLALMLDTIGRHLDAATELRAILVEKPDAQGIRVILARMLAQAGEGGAARREFRQAEEAGLPPAVEAVVHRYIDALRSSKPVGGSLSLALVADNNVNRATRSDTLDTVIAPFQLSEDAQAQPGVGANLSGQFYVRAPLANRIKVLARLSGQGDFYDKHQFNDMRGGGQIGLEWTTGRDRFEPSIGRSYRWFGGDRYATTNTLSLGWRHKAGLRAQIDGTITVGKANYARNDGLDGWIYDVSLRYERALSSNDGASISLSAQRQASVDPGYATKSGGLDALYWRQMGALAVYGTVGLHHLGADQRLLLFPQRRMDWIVTATAGASLNRSIAGFTPLIRASYTRDRSTITLYDYTKFRVELGLSRPF